MKEKRSGDTPGRGRGSTLASAHVRNWPSLHALSAEIILPCLRTSSQTHDRVLPCAKDCLAVTDHYSPSTIQADKTHSPDAKLPDASRLRNVFVDGIYAGPEQTCWLECSGKWSGIWKWLVKSLTVTLLKFPAFGLPGLHDPSYESTGILWNGELLAPEDSNLQHQPVWKAYRFSDT